MENEPVIKLELVDGTESEATRANTSLFRHMGHYAIYDHVFIVLDEEKSHGTYIFSNSLMYPQIVQFMVENEYPMHLNLQTAADCDIQAWEHMVSQDAASDLESGIPEEWIGEA